MLPSFLVTNGAWPVKRLIGNLELLIRTLNFIILGPFFFSSVLILYPKFSTLKVLFFSFFFKISHWWLTGRWRIFEWLIIHHNPLNWHWYRWLLQTFLFWWGQWWWLRKSCIINFILIWWVLYFEPQNCFLIAYVFLSNNQLLYATEQSSFHTSQNENKNFLLATYKGMWHCNFYTLTTDTTYIYIL